MALFINCRDNTVLFMVIYSNVVHKGSSFQVEYGFANHHCT